MLIYRIVHQMYRGTLFASGLQGRWSSAGNKVLYAAESIPLAFLEHMVRRQGVGFNNDFQIIFLSVPDSVLIEEVNIHELGLEGSHSACQPIGDKWYYESKDLALKVPSAVMPEAFNYVINTNHPDYKSVTLVGVPDLVPDPRTDDILKKYP